MTQYLPEFLTVALLHLMAVISPGPDFLMITRNSLVYSRRTGIFSAIGLGLGILVHVTYSIIGIGLIISQSIVLFSIIKFLGAGYLIYVGYKSIMAKTEIVNNNGSVTEQLPDLKVLEAIKTGFLTNVLNPKATLFFFALFSQVINHNTPSGIKVLYGLEMSLATFAWFAFLSVILGNSFVKQRLAKFQHYVSKTMGWLLVGIGIKIAFSRE